MRGCASTCWCEGSRVTTSGGSAHSAEVVGCSASGAGEPQASSIGRLSLQLSHRSRTWLPRALRCRRRCAGGDRGHGAAQAAACRLVRGEHHLQGSARPSPSSVKWPAVAQSSHDDLLGAAAASVCRLLRVHQFARWSVADPNKFDMSLCRQALRPSFIAPHPLVSNPVKAKRAAFFAWPPPARRACRIGAGSGALGLLTTTRGDVRLADCAPALDAGITFHGACLSAWPPCR